MSWVDALRHRVVPVAGGLSVPPSRLLVILAAAVLVVLLPLLWLRLRLVVTLVHELGHAVVGMSVGRHFDGFVLRGDMSGRAVTTGRSRGLGRIATTWSGYPAPPILGALLVWGAVRGWAAPLVTAGLVILVIALTRVRSLLTAVVVGLAVAGTAAMWWWRVDTVQQLVLVAIGVVLLLGGWRHLAALTHDRSTTSDPAVLAALTHVPRVVWTASFALVHLTAMWVVTVQLRALVPRG